MINLILGYILGIVTVIVIRIVRSNNKSKKIRLSLRRFK